MPYTKSAGTTLTKMPTENELYSKSTVCRTRHSHSNHVMLFSAASTSPGPVVTYMYTCTSEAAKTLAQAFVSSRLDYCNSATVRTCFMAFRQIRSVRRSLSRDALLTLIRALVISKADYCCSVMASLAPCFIGCSLSSTPLPVWFSLPGRQNT